MRIVQYTNGVCVEREGKSVTIIKREDGKYVISVSNTNQINAQISAVSFTSNGVTGVNNICMIQETIEDLATCMREMNLMQPPPTPTAE